MSRLLEVQCGQDGSALLLDGIEAAGVESQSLQDGGGHLSGFDKARYRAGRQAGLGYQYHYVGVILREAAMLRLLLGTSGVDHTHVWLHDDIGRAGVAARRQPRRIEHRLQRGSIEDLADSGRGRVLLQYSGRG